MYVSIAGQSGVKTDVFEVLYQKPTAAASSTRSSTLSERTNASKLSSAKGPDFDGSTYRKSSKKLFDKWRQQEVHDTADRKMLANYRDLNAVVQPPALVDRNKWHENQFIKLDVESKRKKAAKDADELKYRTFSKRRTFQPDYIDPTDNRSLVWFVAAAAAATEGGDSAPTLQSASRPEKPVSRQNTFKVEARPNVNTYSRRRDSTSPPTTTTTTTLLDGPNRRFLNEPIRVEITQPDSSVKVVPVGVATPYNSIRNVMPPSSRHPTYFSGPNEPIKIVIDRGGGPNRNGHSFAFDHHHDSSPPPAYSPSYHRQTSPQRTFSSSTVIIGNDDGGGGDDHHHHRQYSNNGMCYESPKVPPRRTQRSSAYDDVLIAVRAPGVYRGYNSHSNGYGGPKPGHFHQQQPRFVSTIKVKPHHHNHKPAWR